MIRLIKKIKPLRFASGWCFGLALFFKFCLIGYSITALFFLALGVVLLLYYYLPRKFRIMLTALILVGVIAFTAAVVPVVKASKGTPEMDADYLIVLGAGVNGSTPSLSMVNRLDAALLYMEEHPDCIAVVSGGQGKGEYITEADAMCAWLMAHGVAPERIIEEMYATSTEENLRFSLALIPEPESKTIAVCSSEYHLYRAQLLAKSMGYDMGGIAAKTTKPILKLNYFAREALGLTYLRIFGNL